MSRKRRKRAKGGPRRGAVRQGGDGRRDDRAAARRLAAKGATDAPAADTAPADPRLPWIGLVALFGVAFGLRAWVAAELGRTALYQVPQLDQSEFLIWAQGLMERGFSWPALPTKGPGYPIFLAALLRATGESLAAVRLVQAALGGATAVLTALLAGRVYGPLPALLAGAAVALYGPLVYVDTALLAEGLFVFLLLAALLAYRPLSRSATLAVPSRPWPRAVLVGVLIGAAVLVRATAVALLPALALATLVDPAWGGRYGWRSARRWAIAAVVVAAGLALVLPIGRSMRQATGSSVVLQGYGGLNLYMGNDPAGDGVPSARVGAGWDRLDQEAADAGCVTAAEQDRYYVDKAGRAIADDPIGWLGLLAEKALWLIQADEIRDSHAYAFFRARSRALSLLPGFGLLFPFAVWGLVVAIRRRQVPLSWAIHLAIFAATCIGIIVASRYRLPMIPLLAIFAGLGLADVAGAIRSGEQRQVLAAVAVALAAFLAGHARAHEPSRNLAEEWAMSGHAELERGELEAARRAFDKALAADPESVLALHGEGRRLLAEGRLAEGRAALEEAIRLNPSYARAHADLGAALAASGRSGEAIAAYRRSLELRPDYFPALEAIGPLLLSAGELEEAETVYRRLVELVPSRSAGHLGLARLAGAARRPAEGYQHARRAAELAPADPETWMTAAMLALDAGNGAAAEESLRRAEGLSGRTPQVLWAWALRYRLAGDLERVDRSLRELLSGSPGFRPAAQLLLTNAEALGRRAEAEAFLGRLPPPGPTR